MQVAGTPTRLDADRARATLGAAIAATVGVMTITLAASSGSLVAGIATMAIAVFGVWLVVSERYTLSLAILVLYLALADGYLKLKFENDATTLARDVLLYAIVVGAAVRWLMRRESFKWPPLSGWVIAWSAAVLLQLFNPANSGLGISLASVRPHLEFVVLFFFGYHVIRTVPRLRGALVVLVFVAAVNGAVSVAQFGMSPDEFAKWGPGYERRIKGSGDVSARVSFDKESGELRTRPFGLGADMGFGGALGMLAAPAAVALLVGTRRLAWRLLALGLAGGVAAAVIASQQRFAVVGAIVGLGAFVALAAASRRFLPVIAGLTVAAAISFVVITAVAGTRAGALERYDSIAPGKVVSTTVEYRRDTIEKIPEYATEFPFGAGIGTVGPAGGVSQRNKVRRLNAESQFTFLLIEVGLPGLLILLGLNLRLLQLGFFRIRRLVGPARLYVAALVASLLAGFVTWVIGVSTATTPGAPFFWFAAGVAAYWLAERAKVRPSSLASS